MADLDNYELEPFWINRSRGSILGQTERYLPQQRNKGDAMAELDDALYARVLEMNRVAEGKLAIGACKGAAAIL